MRTIWGAVTEIRDLGVVAENCPNCERITSCLLRSVCRGDYVFFVRMTDPLEERSCLCTDCLKAFPCVHWRYAAVVPIQEAKTLPLDGLLARTNPVLAERIQFKEQVGVLGGDACFAVAYQHLEGMRPGALRSKLLQELLGWDKLGEEQRALLAQQIGARARAWHFAGQIAKEYPEHAGCLAPTVAALVAGSAFVLVPALRDWLWGSVAVVASVSIAAFINYMLATRRVNRWTRCVLIPEALDANVSLDCLVAVIDDVPGSWHALTEDLWPIKQQLETIRSLLIADGKMQKQ